MCFLVWCVSLSSGGVKLSMWWLVWWVILKVLFDIRWVRMLFRVLIGGEIDILLLLRMISMLVLVMLVLFRVLKVMLVDIVLLLMMVMVLWFLFLCLVVSVMLRVVEIEVDEWLMLKVLYRFFVCLGKLEILLCICSVFMLVWWLVRILCG